MSFLSSLIESGKRLFDIEEDVTEDDNCCAPDPNDTGFTAAIVGLGAKMAAADGRVTDDEIMAFSRVFRTDPKDQASVRRVFNLAQQTVHGYESYARKIGQRYKNRPCLLEGVLDGLFIIAGADGVYTSDEEDYLKTVSEAFGFDAATFRRIKACHMGPHPNDPYHVLGVEYDADFADIRKSYRRLMSDYHPDRVVYNGAPREFEHAAHDKAAQITSAYARIRAERGMIIAP